jgi:K+-sensing histidine kinase KdpD
MNDDDIQKKSENSFYKALFPDRLNRLIDKILDLEKFETGKQKLYLSKKYFKTITNTLDSVRQLIINKISLSVYWAKTEIKRSMTKRIIQVIHNCQNAIKFCSKMMVK